METMANPHTAEELARLSTLAHNAIGWLLVVMTALQLREALRGLPAGRGRFLWPGLGLFIGLGLTGGLIVHFVVTHRVSPFVDPAQNQHQLIGLLIGLGSLGEALRRRRADAASPLRFAWPLALVGVGAAFLLHEQGTTEALLVHWALAATMIVAGAALLAAALATEGAQATRLFGTFLLAFAAAQLVAFTEQPGAHGAHEGAAPAAPEHRTH